MGRDHRCLHGTKADSHPPCYRKVKNMPNRMVITPCDASALRESHPCDPQPPCDVCKGKPLGKPTLCLNLVKNKMESWQTRCQNRPFMPTDCCGSEMNSRRTNQDPCVEQDVCVPGHPPAKPCPPIALCKEKVKHLPPKIIRCPSPSDIYSVLLCRYRDILSKRPCHSSNPCRKPIQLDPFELEKTMKEERAVTFKPVKPPKPRPDPLTSPILCNNKELLLKPLPTRSRCGETIMIDPFKFEKEIAALRDPPKVNDPCIIDHHVQ